jgi:hypothetical protein
MNVTERPRSEAIEIKRHESYPSDDLRFLQRTHPLRGAPFGRLVYVADSIMQPMRTPGFGMHPHANVEVVSYVVDGELTHQDSQGNVGVVPPGGFQRITAGTGIRHDESNRTSTPLRMFQIWFEPAALDVSPDYDVISSEPLMRPNAFATIMSPTGGSAAMPVNADATISVGRFAAGKTASIDVGEGRAALLYLVEGSATWDGTLLHRQDQLRLWGATFVQLVPTEDSLFLWIESAAAPPSTRS